MAEVCGAAPSLEVDIPSDVLCRMLRHAQGDQAIRGGVGAVGNVSSLPQGGVTMELGGA
jgi:hypothetical protein